MKQGVQLQKSGWENEELLYVFTSALTETLKPQSLHPEMQPELGPGFVYFS